VPYFVTLNIVELITTLITFVILILLLVFSAQILSKIPGIGEVIERFNRWIISVIYIGLGLFIIIENETVQTIYNLIMN
ncbi:cadmium transporter, partial [Staphylococcus shinii]